MLLRAHLKKIFEILNYFNFGIIQNKSSMRQTKGKLGIGIRFERSDRRASSQILSSNKKRARIFKKI